MSRNKENSPLTTTRRASGPATSSPDVNPSEEFFTDSLLDASRIPTPSIQKQSISKARRVIPGNSKTNNKVGRGGPNASQRPSNSGDHARRPKVQSRQSAPAVGKAKSPSALRTSQLSTPPRSRDSVPLMSPSSDLSSPPRELPDVYQQIADETLLAEAERDYSDPDEPLEQRYTDVASLAPSVQPQRKTELLPPYSPSSRASTPTQHLSDADKENRLLDRTESLSEASGLSFLKELTDQDLAAKVTPGLSENARHWARMKAFRDNQRPIAFSRAGRRRPERSESPGESQLPRLVAFSKSGRRLLRNGTSDEDRHSDPGDRPVSHHSNEIFGQGRQNNDIWHDEDRPHKPLPINTRIDRNFQPSRIHNFPADRPGSDKVNLDEPVQTINSHATTPYATVNVTNNHRTSQSTVQNQVLGQIVNTKNDSSEPLTQSSRVSNGIHDRGRDEPSQVDWVVVGAENSLRSVTSEPSLSLNEDMTQSTTHNLSPEKSRRWDNDFTGQSFQVSESPPVRSRQPILDQPLSKEIQGLTKQAVTTNRLTQIRERQSQEHLRTRAQSPASRSTSVSSHDRRQSNPPAKDDETVESIGEVLLNSPAVLLRTSSSGAIAKERADRPDLDRGTSHDHLQRLARAMSTTPKSSPAAENTKEPDVKAVPISFDHASEEGRRLEAQTPQVSSNQPTVNGISDNEYAKTPKVVGAWTDTILPDTVKTAKQVEKQPKYAQTPHVGAGGWIDTPGPTEQKKAVFGVSIPTIVEEVPEELVSGIAKDSVSDKTVKVEESKGIETVDVEPVTDVPQSGLATLLDRAKQRLNSQDIPTAGRDDTLHLGNDTIESLQDLLDPTDLTILSKLSLVDEDEGRPMSEAELLERLGTKLGRLQNNIHDARKGISKLEHQVSLPPDDKRSLGLEALPSHLDRMGTCSVCGNDGKFLQIHNHDGGNAERPFPSSVLTFSVPIPLLFHPRRRELNERLPRPTPLGWITISIWTWYVLETIMCELYGHPSHAEYYVWPTQPEPRFPYVLPTVLGRWANKINIVSLFLWPYILQPLYRICVALSRITGMWLGWTDGFVDSSGMVEAVTDTVKATAAAISSTVTNIVDGSGEGVDLSMMNDDFI